MQPTDGASYSPIEALADVRSGPLQHIGTTVWPGVFQIPSCVYRNSRVIVIDVYCTTKEINTFSILVLHPERGRVRIYAEAQAPISTIDRSRYQQWTLDSEDPPPAGRISPALSTSMNLDQLLAWEQQRNKLYLPGCWVEHWSARDFPAGTSAGVIGAFAERQAASGQGKCRRKGREVAKEWAALAPRLSDPPPAWYALVKTFRALAPKHGRPDPRSGDPVRH